MRLLVAVLVVLGVSSHARLASPCSCVPPRPAKVELKRADVVFHGKVVTIETLEEPSSTSLGRLRVTLAVERVWKGDVAERFVMQAGSPHGGMCEFPFEVGGEYVIYGHGADGSASTSTCSRSHPVAKVEPDFKALGPGKAPRKSTP